MQKQFEAVWNQVALISYVPKYRRYRLTNRSNTVTPQSTYSDAFAVI